MHFTCWDHKKGHLILLVEGILASTSWGKGSLSDYLQFFNVFFTSQVVVNMNWIFPKNHGISKLVAWRCNETLCNTDPNPSFLEGPQWFFGLVKVWWVSFLAHNNSHLFVVSFTLLRCRESVKRKKRRYQARRRKKPRLRRTRIWSGDFEHFLCSPQKLRKMIPVCLTYFSIGLVQLNHQLVN